MSDTSLSRPPLWKRWLPVLTYAAAFVVCVGLWSVLASTGYRVLRDASQSFAWYQAPASAPAQTAAGNGFPLEGRSVRVTR